MSQKKNYNSIEQFKLYISIYCGNFQICTQSK